MERRAFMRGEGMRCGSKKISNSTHLRVQRKREAEPFADMCRKRRVQPRPSGCTIKKKTPCPIDTGFWINAWR